MNNPRRNQRGIGAGGFCLLELMCAVAIGTVVIAVTFGTLHRLDGSFRRQQQDIGLVQDARLGLAVWEQDVRAAMREESGVGGAMVRTTSEEMSFAANVSGLVTTLSTGAAAGQTQLVVEDGRGWVEGKRVQICPSSRCVDGRLARDGQKTQITLETPLSEAVPAGTEVSVLNDVRYYVSPDAKGTVKLMRQVDGGANSVSGDLREVRFQYRTREGVFTTDAAAVAVADLELVVGDARRSFRQQVAPRT